MNNLPSIIYKLTLQKTLWWSIHGSRLFIHGSINIHRSIINSWYTYTA